jgi:RNA polymerase sigma factor (sigma-70 family)
MMAAVQLGPVIPHLVRLVSRAEGMSDAQLLQVFARDNDQVAFTAIVERHGRLVLSVCRHVLGHVQDAEDAFQATFLVLARKAPSILKQSSLASWLHGVAYRMCIKAKRGAARRRAHEKNAGTPSAAETTDELTWREAQAILDEEITRLPDKYRAPLVLCCLDGRSRIDAAEQLGIKEGTLSSRLAAARKRLQERLALRGVTLATVLAAASLTTTTVSAALAQQTVQAAAGFAAGQAVASLVPAQVLWLARGALNAMIMTKVKTCSALVLGLALLTAGSGSALYYSVGLVQTSAAADDGGGEEVAGGDRATGFFRDVTDESGIHFTYRNGEEAGQYTILESLGGGVAVIDYDGDGLLDIFVTGGGYFGGMDKTQIRGHGCKLYRNLGNGTFQDVTEAAGLDERRFYTHGAAVVDYDCDGWPDLLVTGWGRVILYHNESDGKGGRKFVDVTEKAGLPTGLWTTSAAFADLDGDGFPDLFVCQYVDWSFANHPTCNYDGKGQRDICPPKSFKGLPPKLFHNNGDGTFTDVSKEAGLKSGGQDECKGMGVVIADFDGDGKPDIFVANDTVDHALYHNRSTRGKLLFVDMALQAGVARDALGAPNGGKGIAIGDINSSGRPSLLVTNYENEMHALYFNENRGGTFCFTYGSPKAGLARIGQRYVGWGTAFVDCDNDGDLDLFIANGHVLKHPTGQAQRKQRPVLLRNLGNGRFEDVTKQAGVYFQKDHNARGVAVIDFDNDGRADLIISHLNEPVVILRNQTVEKDHHWIGFELVGKNRRDVVGAKITLQTESREQTSFAKSGGSYASSSDPRHLFGLGKTEKVKHITVTWPGGQKQHWDGLAIDRYWRLIEGEGAEEARPRK